MLALSENKRVAWGCRDEEADADMEKLLSIAREARALAIAKGVKQGQSAEMSISCKARSIFLRSLLIRCLGHSFAAGR
jgi:hypothetical protein